MRSRRSTHHLRRIRRPASSPRVEILEDRWLLATFTVANTNDGGAGSLRQALLDANATPGTDTVAYNLPGTGPFTIRPTSALPRVDDPIIIDGYTQPGSVVNTRATGDNAVLRVVIDGSAAGAGVTGLTIAAGGSTVRGLVINGFSGAGLKLLGGGNSLIEGNFLGTNASGTAALGNGNLGDGSSTDCLVVFNSSGNTIGGTTAASRNLISGNRGAGLVIEGLGAGAANNLIAGNSIGTNAAGTAALGNGRDGVRIVNAPENTVGGTTPGAGNIIAGTAYVGGISGSGVAISGPGATGNLIVGNSIGTNAAVSIDLGNAGVGVQIDDASGNTIGGTAGGAGNTIAFNRNAGVAVRSGRRNAIAGNAIYSNGGLGIDLGADGMTPNDPDDADTGPNDLQNAPLLISAAPSGGTTTVGGTLHGRRNTAFRIDFHASGTQPTNGVGERWASLGSRTVSTDDSGNARFTATFPVAAAPGADFAATATDPAGNTSEYSRSVALGAGDRFEANDSLTNATDLGFVEGYLAESDLTIHTAGDEDWYRFQFPFIDTGRLLGRFFARLEFANAQGDLDLELYNEVGNRLAMSNGGSDREEVSLGNRRLGGVYYVRVFGFNGAVNLGGYTLTFVTPGATSDRFEPNDTQATATDLGTVQGERVERNLTLQRGDFDWYRFQTIAPGLPGQFVRIDRGNRTSDDFYFGLYDAHGGKVAGSSGTGDLGEISLADRSSGVYYLAVYNTRLANPNYTLTINAPGAPADVYEPNDSRATATELGTVRGQYAVPNLSVHETGNDDWFHFTIAEPATAGHKVRIDFQSSLGDLDLVLSTAGGAEIARSSGGGNSEEIALPNPNGVTDFVARVVGYAGALNPYYTLTIIAPGSLPDRLEPNDGFDRATNLRTLTGTSRTDDVTITPGDQDYFQFTTVATGGATHAVRLTYPAEAGNLRLELYDGNRTLLPPVDGARGAATLSLAGRPAGTYYVKVSGLTAATATRYALRIDPPTPAPREWTILVYTTVSNLGPYLFADINELEVAASRLSNDVQFAALYDQNSAPGQPRYATGEAPDSPWGDTGRALIVPDTNPDRIATPFERIGEQNTGDPVTLVQFVTWAVAAAPARHYALILSDHGNGLRGFNRDDNDGGTATGDDIVLNAGELAGALATLATAGTRFDLVGFDSCLMAMAEVGYQLRSYAPVLVASEEDEAPTGFDYTTAFAPLERDPGADAEAVAAGLVQSFQAQYQDRIGVLDTLSATRGGGYDGLAAALGSFTAAVRAVPATSHAVLRDVLRDGLDAAAHFGTRRTGYRDLGQFLDGVADAIDRTRNTSAALIGVRDAARTARGVLDGLIVARTQDKHRSSGLSIYLPRLGLAAESNFYPTYQTAPYARDFLAATGWDSLFGLLPGGGRVIPPDDGTNDQFTSPTRLNVVSGRFTLDGVSIDSPADRDHYRFALAASGGAGHRISVSPPSETKLDQPGLLRLTLYDVGQNPLASVTQASLEQVISISLSGRNAGEYVVLVDSANGTAFPEYLLDFDAPTAGMLPDPNPGNTTREKARDLGAINRSVRLYNEVLVPSTEDWFAFSTPKVPAQPGAQGSVRVVLVTPGAQATLQLLRSDAPGVVFGSTAGAGPLLLDYPISGAGERYLIRLVTAGAASYQYNLEVTGVDDLRPDAPRDYDGDGRADLVVWRPGDGTWYARTSASNFTGALAVPWGAAGDVPIPDTDLDGDGRADLVLWRPSSGTWYWRTSTSNFTGATAVQWGAAGDVPVPETDLDGDGKADLVVWRPSTGIWYWRTSTSNFTGAVAVPWGAAGDLLIPHTDLDGDGRTDLVVWRPGTGTWYWRTSTSNFAGAVAVPWGAAGDIPIPDTDLDGDGRADLVVWRPSTGTWYWRTSTSNFAGALAVPWGAAGDVPIPDTDLDGDGRADLVVWRPSSGTWYWRTSTSNFAGALAVPWGAAGDVPIPDTDLDGDSRADLVLWRPSTATWYWRTSTSNFTGAVGVQWGAPGDVPIFTTGGAIDSARAATGSVPGAAGLAAAGTGGVFEAQRAEATAALTAAPAPAAETAIAPTPGWRADGLDLGGTAARWAARPAGRPSRGRPPATRPAGRRLVPVLSNEGDPPRATSRQGALAGPSPRADRTAEALVSVQDLLDVMRPRRRNRPGRPS